MTGVCRVLRKGLVRATLGLESLVADKVRFFNVVKSIVTGVSGGVVHVVVVSHELAVKRGRLVVLDTRFVEGIENGTVGKLASKRNGIVTVLFLRLVLKGKGRKKRGGMAFRATALVESLLPRIEEINTATAVVAHKGNIAGNHHVVALGDNGLEVKGEMPEMRLVRRVVAKNKIGISNSSETSIGARTPALNMFRLEKWAPTSQCQNNTYITTAEPI